MAMPGQIDEVLVEVVSGGVLRHSWPYAVGPGQAQVPATLTLVASDDPSRPVTVHVAGRKNGEFRTYREITTTAPVGRSAKLRMPIQWLCDGTAIPAEPRDGSALAGPSPKSTCPPGETCKAGLCLPSATPEEILPAYDATTVWGGADDPQAGACFETVACMIGGEIVQPDASCTIPKPEGDRINVALRVVESGICDESGATCFVPLDAEDDEGWLSTADGTRIALPLSVCNRLNDRSIKAVYVSTQCDRKFVANPPCGDWSSVPDLSPITTPAQERLQVKLVAPLASNAMKEPCCPLMADGPLLYTCLCDPRIKESAELIELDPAQPDRARPVAVLNPPKARTSISFAATITDGSLFIADDRVVRRRPLRTSAAPLREFMVPGAVYFSTVMLGDSSSVYMLASDVIPPGMTMAMGSPVQVLRMSTEGTTVALDVNANRPVYQFDADSTGLYVASDNDTVTAGRTMRVSSIVRLQKQTGVRTQISPSMSLLVDDPFHGGYIGVQVSQSVFGLYEHAVMADGTRMIELHAFPLDGSGASAPVNVVFKLQVEPQLTQVALIGAVDGAAILSRIEYGNPAAGPSSGSLIVVMPNTSHRAIADFKADYTLPGLALDGDFIYFMNDSGRVFSYPREGLQ